MGKLVLMGRRGQVCDRVPWRTRELASARNAVPWKTRRIAVIYKGRRVCSGSPLLFAPRCLHPAEVPNALVRQEGTRRASAHGWGCCVGEHQPGRTLKMPSLVATYCSHLQLQRPDCSLRAAPRKLLPRVEALPAFGSYSGALVPHQADTSPHLTSHRSPTRPRRLESVATRPRRLASVGPPTRPRCSVGPP